MAERAHPEDRAFRGSVYEERLRERYNFCQPFIQQKDVLDVPCGTGWGSSMLSGYTSLTGLDIDPASISYARDKFLGISFVEGTMHALPFEDSSFDVVICLEGLEHVMRSQVDAFLKEVHRVLRTTGTLIVTAPLLNNGKHSGNPYHRYEFQSEELEQLLTRGFELVSFETFAGGDGPEVRFVGRRLDHWVTQPLHTSPLAFEPFQLAHEWLLSLRHASGFRFAQGHETSLMATCWAILSLEGLRQLDSISQDERNALRAYLQDMQQEETGLFRDPLLDTHPVTSSTHDEEYLLHQMTYFAIQALDALGARPRLPLRFMERFAEPVSLTAWLEGLNWADAWLQSNRVMFVLAFLIYGAEVERDPSAPSRYHAVLDWLERAQDPETGLWGIRQGASVLNAMAAAYHFLPFFEYVHRPICSLNALIDSTLTLQQPDGLFAPGPGGGACEDLDAIDVLTLAGKYTSHRSPEISGVLVRAFWAIWNAQNPDGGFGYAQRNTDKRYRFSSWAPMEVELRAGDTWATWFRLLALATIKSAFPEDLPDIGLWQFRRWPALGYHRAGRGLTPHERAVLPLWVRPLPEAPHSDTPPAISVVIPCYNLGRYLYEAVRSALHQTVQHVEVIVVDDGSTDEITTLLIDNLRHPCVRVIRQANRGLPAARNNGIREARSALLCCLDADDRLRPGYFEQAMSVLEHDPQVGFVTSHYQEFDNRHGTIAYPSSELPEMLVTNRATVASVFRREAWERAGGYCESLSGMHDWDLWIGILAAGYRAVVLPSIEFEYRVRGGSMYDTTRQPENYARLVGQLVARHPEVYQRWYAEVVVRYAHEVASLAMYADGQARLAQQRQSGLAQFQPVLQAMQERTTYLEQQIQGLNHEIGNWQAIAAARDAWSKELEAARDYHAQQARNWQMLATEREEQYQARIGQLEGERDRLLREGLSEHVLRRIRSRSSHIKRTAPTGKKDDS
jgi:glycosyltransferase involved in cell wall biosynthesis/SAM-dependent methyltransferase